MYPFINLLLNASLENRNTSLTLNYFNIRLEVLKPVIERFLEKISVSKVNFYEGKPCWEWTAAKDSAGYGMFWLNRLQGAHRVSYEYFNGKIPEDLVINHKCRNRCCVNTQHLEVITNKENIQIGICAMRNKTHCPQGHEYTEENTYHQPKGGRNCRICGRIKCRQYYQYKKTV